MGKINYYTDNDGNRVYPVTVGDAVAVNGKKLTEWIDRAALRDKAWQDGISIAFLELVRKDGRVYQCINPKGSSSPPNQHVSFNDGSSVSFNDSSYITVDNEDDYSLIANETGEVNYAVSHRDIYNAVRYLKNQGVI